MITVCAWGRVSSPRRWSFVRLMLVDDSQRRSQTSRDNMSRSEMSSTPINRTELVFIFQTGKILGIYEKANITENSRNFFYFALLCYIMIIIFVLAKLSISKGKFPWSPPYPPPPKVIYKLLECILQGKTCFNFVIVMAKQNKQTTRCNSEQLQLCD